MFLAFWNPFAAIGKAILSFFIGILLFLDSIIYSLISWIYQIILVLCQIDILNNSFEIDALIRRIYVIVGVIVLFLLAYGLLKSLVNPDDALKGKKSPVTLIKDLIISIVLIAIIPTIFSFAMRFQTALLQENTIGKIILGSTSVIQRNENGDVVEEQSSSDLIKSGGISIASNVLRAFLHPNYSSCTEDETSVTGYDCSNVIITQSAYGVVGSIPFDEFWNNTVEKGLITSITDLSSNIVDGEVIYYYFISTAAGIFVLFVLLSYCFDVALRLVKLAIYQLIAPLPILSRIVPNDQANKIFENWLKATISTYVEVFIRLGILFFSILIIKIVVQNFITIFSPFFSGSDSWTVILFAQLFVIIGIILFIKQAPQIIKDLTGLDSGKYGKSLMRGIGMMTSTLGGGATAAIRKTVTDLKEHPEYSKGKRVANTLSALGGGMRRGLWHGSKVEKFSDIPKMAGKTASNTLSHQSQVKADGGFIKYHLQSVTDKIGDIKEWAGGSFEAQQKILDTVNEFLKDAKAVKSESEGIVRDKKYLFTIGEIGENGKKDGIFGEKEVEVDSGMRDANNRPIMKKVKVPRVQIKENTSLSEVEAIIESLKASGDVEDAKIADSLNNLMQIRIKTLGKELTKASIQIENATNVQDKEDVSDEFTKKYMSSSSKGLISEISPSITKINTAYDIVQQKYDDNSSLEAVQIFKNLTDDNGNKLNLQDNVSKLADELEKQSSRISKNIKIEQENRKSKSSGDKK